MDCNEPEKAALREAMNRHGQAQQGLEAAVTEAQRRKAELDAVINTVIRLRGLDPARHVLACDMAKDTWEIRETGAPLALPNESNGHQAAEPEGQPQPG